jgi:RNA polymerase sigma factor for flagellar operon FliA
LTDPDKRRRLTEAETEKLVAEHAPLVSAIARTLLRKLPPNVEFDDLVQDGFMGLLGAILQCTRSGAGGQFKAYLSQRIRGAMIDGLREADPATRKVRGEMRAVELAIQRLCHQHGRFPSEHEVAEAMSMSLEDYHRLLQDARGYELFSLEDFDDADPERDFLDWCAKTSSDPLAALQRKALQRTLLIALNDLTDREQNVMKTYYVEGLTMRAIAERLSVTEGRVSQIHTQAIAKLRASVVGDEPRHSILAPRWRVA